MISKWWTGAVAAGALIAWPVLAEDPVRPADPSPEEQPVPAPTVEEARARAKLLHETIHGALQVMHRDFFDDEDLHSLPSESLEDVFKELARSLNVEVRWLIVNAKVMNVDHKPRDEFEKKAAEVLDSEKDEFERVEDGRYRRAGKIRLHNSCLKCHVPKRTSLQDRAAGLVISMPVKL